MSTSAQSTVPATRGALLVVLMVALGVATAAAIIFAALYLTNRSRGGATSGDSPERTADSEPYNQKGTWKPEGLGSGVLYYPVPYASPPHLAVSPSTRYLIVKQDEYGFTWVDRARAKEFAGLIAAVPELSGVIPRSEAEKFDAKQPEITWEAKGIRASASEQAMRPYEQTGTFQSDFGQHGQVNFPYPYASPPNVELSGSHEKTVITECTATGFKWKNGSSPGRPSWEAGTITWKAKGIRATQLPKG